MLTELLKILRLQPSLRVDSKQDDASAKVTFETIRLAESSKWVKTFKIFGKFHEVLQDSTEIDRKTACKVVKMIEVEHSEDGLEKMLILIFFFIFI